MGSIRVPVGALGGETRGPGVPLLVGDSSGRVPWCLTLDSEGGPVLCLPAWGAGPAHVHALGSHRQLWHPVGTQPG